VGTAKDKIAPETTGKKLDPEIKRVYSTLNQSKKRERYDKPLQQLETWYYDLLIEKMKKVKERFNEVYKEGK